LYITLIIGGPPVEPNEVQAVVELLAAFRSVRNFPVGRINDPGRALLAIDGGVVQARIDVGVVVAADILTLLRRARVRIGRRIGADVCGQATGFKLCRLLGGYDQVLELAGALQAGQRGVGPEALKIRPAVSGARGRVSLGDGGGGGHEGDDRQSGQMFAQECLPCAFLLFRHT
jgi:hypothetical protein